MGSGMVSRAKALLQGPDSLDAVSMAAVVEVRQGPLQSSLECLCRRPTGLRKIERALCPGHQDLGRQERGKKEESGCLPGLVRCEAIVDRAEPSLPTYVTRLSPIKSHSETICGGRKSLFGVN